MDRYLKIANQRYLVSFLLIATLLIQLCIITALKAEPNKYFQGCVGGYQRYTKYLEEFKLATTLNERALICRKATPEIGAANCEWFIQSGSGSITQLDWARKVAGNLYGMYSKCASQ